VKQLSLNLTPEATFELFQYMQGGVTGSVTREEWLRVISIGRGEAVLQSLGVTAGDIGEASSGTVEPTQAGAEESSESAPNAITDRLRDSIDIVAAALKYNSLSVDEGYDAFDIDEDGRVSFEDLKNAIGQLSINMSEEAMTELYEHLGGGAQGYVMRQDWVRIISTGRGGEVLKSMGVDTVENATNQGADTNDSGDNTSRLRNSIDVVAAALNYNSLSVKDGYDAFDIDEDGQVSLEDLENVVSHLKLNLSVEAINELYEHLGGQKDGSVSRDEWQRVIATGRGH
jgi:Ca2+-binding EF-hand superfamily protein